VTSSTDPVTGLTWAPDDFDEVDYPAKCRHCARPIRPHQAWWLDEAGLFRCMKDVDHSPMPAL